MLAALPAKGVPPMYSGVAELLKFRSRHSLKDLNLEDWRSYGTIVFLAQFYAEMEVVMDEKRNQARLSRLSRAFLLIAAVTSLYP